MGGTATVTLWIGEQRHQMGTGSWKWGADCKTSMRAWKISPRMRLVEGFSEFDIPGPWVVIGVAGHYASWDGMDWIRKRSDVNVDLCLIMEVLRALQSNLVGHASPWAPHDTQSILRLPQVIHMSRLVWSPREPQLLCPIHHRAQNLPDAHAIPCVLKWRNGLLLSTGLPSPGTKQKIGREVILAQLS
ncbi:hypothetical protein Tco_0765172 [Tanacetum coccineum]